MTALLNGCATTAQPKKNTVTNTAHFAQLNNITAFKFTGRIGIQIPKKGYSGSIKWQHTNPQSDEIIFYSPLGSQVAVIKQSAQKATLPNHKGKTFSAPTAQALIKKHLGWQLPVKQLSQWLIGMPEQQLSANTKIQYDEQGHVANFSFLDWHVNYSKYAKWDHVTLPGKLSIKSKDLSLKLIAKDWQVTQHQ